MLHRLVKTKTPSQSLTGKEIEVVFTKHLQRAWYLCQKVKMHCLMESLHQSKKVDISLTFHFSKNCWEKLSLCLCCVMLNHSVVSGCLQPHDCVALQAPLSMGFPRQEYWSGLPFPSPGDHPDPTSPALAGIVFTTETLGKSTPTLSSRNFILRFLLKRHENTCL